MIMILHNLLSKSNADNYYKVQIHIMDLDIYKHRAIPGSPLAEVFAVIISPDDEDEEYELYGTIEVNDIEGPLYIYNAGPEDSVSICSSESLFLSNRERAILAGSSFFVHINLKDKYGDTEFIKESFGWFPDADGYNKCLVKNVKGKQGSATVCYTVLGVALEANIKAQFIEGETQTSGLNVCGRLVAHYKNGDDYGASHDSKENSQVAILEGTCEDLVDGDVFLLDRSVVALPSYSSLVIGAHFQRYEDDEVTWNGEVEFSASETYSGTTHKDVKGRFGVIRLSVRSFTYVEETTNIQMGNDRFREVGLL